MKTIRQIAEEIGASKQAVYKRYKGKLYNAVLPHARVVAGTIYILEQGEAIIKREFLDDGAYGSAYKEYAPDVLLLMLQRELGIKNQQIAKLTAVAKMQSENVDKLLKLQSKSHPKPKTYKASKKTTQSAKSAPIKRLINK